MILEYTGVHGFEEVGASVKHLYRVQFHFPNQLLLSQGTHCNLEPVFGGPILAGPSPFSLWRNFVSPYSNMNSMVMPSIPLTVRPIGIRVAVGKQN